MESIALMYNSTLAYQIINYDWEAAISNCRRCPELAKETGMQFVFYSFFTELKVPLEIE